MINQSVADLVDNCYNKVQQEAAFKVLLKEKNLGILYYKILSIGVGDYLKQLTKTDVRSFYDYPTWKINEVDILVASLLVSLKVFNNNIEEEYKKSIIEGSSIDYMASQVDKHIKRVKFTN